MTVGILQEFSDNNGIKMRTSTHEHTVIHLYNYTHLYNNTLVVTDKRSMKLPWKPKVKVQTIISCAIKIAYSDNRLESRII